MARVDWKLLHALSNLAFRLVLHFLRRLNPLAKKLGVDAFLANYVPEGLPPASTERRALLPRAMRCTACAICDTECPILVDPHRPRFDGPMGFVLAGLRAAPHYAAVKGELDILTSASCRACRRCERACPEAIPILDLAALAAAELATVERARHALAEVR